MTPDTCPLCLAQTTAAERVENTVLLASNNFLVLPTLGQLCEGWVMVVSKHHVAALADLSVTHLDELMTLIRRTQSLVERAYGATVICEHGGGRGQRLVPGCVNHAHLHITPTQDPAEVLGRLDEILEDGGRTSMASIHDIHHVEGDYVLYGREMGQLVVALPRSQIPSQLFRRVVAQSMGRPDHWDWAVVPGFDNIIATVQTLAGYSV